MFFSGCSSSLAYVDRASRENPTFIIQEGNTYVARYYWPAVITMAVFLFLVPVVASAATLFVSPSTGTFRSGETFTATVRVNTQGSPVNAAEGTLKFDPNFIRVQSLTADGSIFNLNVQDPEFSNTQGTINFAGVILNPGYNGSSGTLLTIRFVARAAGSTAVTFTSGAVLANDGAGTNITNGLSGGNYVIVGQQEASPATDNEPPPTTAGDALLPVVTSPTHPNSDRWYTSNDPRFTWILPSGVNGVSWLIAENATGNPGNLLDGLVDEVSFEDVEDGLHYFHIKFQRNGAFGPIAHYAFRVDTKPPLPFTIRRLADDDDDTNPQPFLAYETSDETSGVQKYRMRIGSGDWFDVPEAPAEHPFRMPVQAPGVHPVTIEAIDGAGQTARAELVITVTSITVPEIVTYPSQTAPDEDFALSGTAEPHSEVTVAAWQIGPIAGFQLRDKPSAERTVTVDGNGRWQMTFPGLAVGKYELVAHASDGRGAVSYASGAVTVRVGNWFVRQLKSFPYWFLALPLWIRILLLGILGLFIWLLIFGWKRRKKKIVAVAKKDKKVRSGLEEVIEDIDVELSTIERLAKSRPLYPEERYLKTKLSDYRKTLRKLAGKRLSRKKTASKK